ncbi:putative S-adenosyl-L-methionine-dependent methyltransferase [Helianthus anomalus]
MIVPEHRETDWNLCTESGHLQLLYDFSNISCFILIGNNLDPNLKPLDYVRTVVDQVDMEKLECELKQLVIVLHPKICFRNRVPKTLFLTYEDDVLQRVVIKRFVGPLVGEFVVEDVQLENKEFRRLVSLGKMKKVEFRIDTGTLIVSSVNDRIRQGFSPRALCLGVGGGALLSFLNSKLGFEVVGVEADEVVLSVARGYFGLTDGNRSNLLLEMLYT